MKEPIIGIVGSSGYIRSALAKYLTRKFKVRVLDKSPYPREIKRQN